MLTFAQVAAVNLDAVPVMSTNRSLPRKEQAALARQLFKQLGIKGVSVTTPNYSMAQSVDVSLPHEPRPDMTGYEQYENFCYSDMPNDVPVKAAELRRSAARDRLCHILTLAFPMHDDRSDTQSDYFDYCWSCH